MEILIIDDKIGDAEAVASILSEIASVTALPTDDPDKAIQFIQRTPKRFALVLIDFNLNIKNLDGLGLARKIWAITDQAIC